MQSIAQAARAADAGGHPLPVAWPSLAARGVEIRGAELTVIAGQPAAGKSAFALATAVRCAVPTLYFCADTAAWTMSVRVVAMVTGMQQDEVERRVLADPGFGAGAMSEVSHIRWCFDGAPSLEDIDDEVAAYEEVFGRNPQMIVIDNLIDVSDGEEEFSALRRTMKELKFLSRDTGAAVVVLHHVTEAASVGEGRAPARSSILGKDTRLPAVVMTLTNDRGWLGVAVVKNRYGAADPSGATVSWFLFDGGRMQIREVVS